MSSATSSNTGQVPVVIVQAVRDAIATTFAAIYGEAPRGEAIEPVGTGTASGVIGILSFMGQPNWSLSLVLPQPTACDLVQRFTGMDVPFDGPDMGDAIGELINVIAGDIVARLEGRHEKSQMGLPSVARGRKVEHLSRGDRPTARTVYAWPTGSFEVVITTASPSLFARSRAAS